MKKLEKQLMSGENWRLNGIIGYEYIHLAFTCINVKQNPTKLAYWLCSAV